MGAVIFTNGNYQGTDDNGDVVANGTVIFNNFHDGTPAVTYKDSIASMVNPYEIPLSPSGKADIYLGGGEYEVILKDSDGFTIRTIPRFSPFMGNSGGLNYAQREESIAIVGQTEILLSGEPFGTLSIYIDGLYQSVLTYSFESNVVTFAEPFVGGEKVIIEYSRVEDIPAGAGDAITGYTANDTLHLVSTQIIT